jgi:hypothetical protein
LKGLQYYKSYQLSAVSHQAKEKELLRIARITMRPFG